MELIKKPFRIGNSAAVLVPKKWENQTIIVKPLEKTVIEDVISILSEKKILEDVKGVYLIGSFAREDYNEDSDIDILVVTVNKSGIIKKDRYEITVVKEKDFVKSLLNNIYSLAMIKEAVPLINKESLERYKKIKSKFNFNKILREIENVFEFNEDDVEMSRDLGEKVGDGTMYSIILRLRQLYILKKIIKNKKFDKKGFISYVDKDSYKAYIRVKNGMKQKDNINLERAEKLLKLTKKWLKELRERK